MKSLTESQQEFEMIKRSCWFAGIVTSPNVQEETPVLSKHSLYLFRIGEEPVYITALVDIAVLLFVVKSIRWRSNDRLNDAIGKIPHDL